MAKQIPKKVIDELKKFWESRIPDPALLPDDDTKIRGVIDTVLQVLDLAPGSPIDADTIKFAIATFQRLKGISGNEGVLTNGLVDMIRQGVLLMDQVHEPTTNRKLQRRVGDAETAYWVRYFVDTDSLASFAGPSRVKTLLQDAWNLWMDHAQFLFVRQVDAPGDGVVVVRGGDVPGGVGLASVLGPGRFNSSNMAVTLDIKEINRGDDQFRALAAHEFGHIIGLGHLGRSGNLMSEVVVDSITRPMDADIQAVQRIYGQPKPDVPLPAPPTDFPLPPRV